MSTPVLPEVDITITDGALGQSAPATRNHAKIGVCSLGVPNQVYTFANETTARASLGNGPLVEDLVYALSVSGGPIYVVPVESVNTAGSVSHTGTGTTPMVVSGTPIVPGTVSVAITTGGTVGTSFSLQVTVNGVAGPIIAMGTSLAYVEPITGLTFTFTTSDTAVLGDTYAFTITTNGSNTAVVHAGTGTSSVTLSGQPYDNYTAIIKVISAEASLGAGGAFQYTLDNAKTWSVTYAVPSGGVFLIPNTGVTATFGAGTLVLGDTYAWTSTAPGYTTTAATAAFNALLATYTIQYEFVDVCGVPSNESAAGALFGVLATLQQSAAINNFVFIFFVMSAPNDTDANLITEFANLTATNGGVMVAAGFCNMTSAVQPVAFIRPASWPICARISAVSQDTDLGQVEGTNGGPLLGVLGLLRDEFVTPGLDAARFATLRTVVDEQGYFCTQGQMMAPVGSDFNLVQRVRIGNIAARTSRTALLHYLNAPVRVNGQTGFILEQDARSIENYVNTRLARDLGNLVSSVSPKDNAGFQASRTDPLLTSPDFNSSTRVLPKAYLKGIFCNVGFTNPAINPS